MVTLLVPPSICGAAAFLPGVENGQGILYNGVAPAAQGRKKQPLCVLGWQWHALKGNQRLLNLASENANGRLATTVDQHSQGFVQGDAVKMRRIEHGRGRGDPQQLQRSRTAPPQATGFTPPSDQARAEGWTYNGSAEAVVQKPRGAVVGEGVNGRAQVRPHQPQPQEIDRSEPTQDPSPNVCAHRHAPRSGSGDPLPCRFASPCHGQRDQTAGRRRKAGEGRQKKEGGDRDQEKRVGRRGWSAREGG